MVESLTSNITGKRESTVYPSDLSVVILISGLDSFSKSHLTLDTSLCNPEVEIYLLKYSEFSVRATTKLLNLSFTISLSPMDILSLFMFVRKILNILLHWSKCFHALYQGHQLENIRYIIVRTYKHIWAMEVIPTKYRQVPALPDSA